VIFATPTSPAEPLRAAIRSAYLADETACVERLLAQAQFDAGARERIEAQASDLVARVRAKRDAVGGLDTFLQEYNLGTQEGVVLLCLAEALLRIPDSATANRLIEDKLASAQWTQHLGHSDSLLVNASTWGLMLSGRLVQLETHSVRDLPSFFARLAARIGEPAVRLALKQAMAILARQFVMGQRIEQAIERAGSRTERRYRHSFDMLGEAALTADDAERYFESYRHAIAMVGASAGTARDIFEAPGVSVKLSALHPRFELARGDHLVRELFPRVQTLAELARAAGIGLTLDAEEAERLEPTLDVFEAVYQTVTGYEGFGIAVQAYQKRAGAVIEWLIAQARSRKRRIPLRLVKGAYWDSEIKRAQEQGLKNYPVFTRKLATDVSYLACARRMLASRDVLYPQFASHNAHTVTAILELAGRARDFEFQRLHGMGEALYGEIVGPEKSGVACRVYAPVGSHEDLLPYLVRRLLENGANTSFLHHVFDEQKPIAQLVADPIDKLRRCKTKPHPRIPLPADIYPQRRNARGLNLHDVEELLPLKREMERALARDWMATPLVGGRAVDGEARDVLDPADRRRRVGGAIDGDAVHVDEALALASAAQPAWDRLPAHRRAEALERAADLIERDRAAFLALLVREGGKCLPDANAEVREAVDYCRYYAQCARADFGITVLPGPTGEHNELQLHGRGVFACVSPWNFPLAIFTGQVAAALAAGNAVIAKPANQTPLVAHAAVKLLHDAGIPPDVLHFVPGPSRKIGPRLLGDPHLTGIVMTGSTETAQTINRQLAAREGALPVLIAETGGLNAMIADSSALPEQIVQDTLRSAFNSAGQRCSALRVLFVQEDIAPRVLALIEGAMAELSIGDPALLSTDVGPLIDEPSKSALEEHIVALTRQGKLLHRAALPTGTEHGSYFAPAVFEIPRFDVLKREVFGPILHVVRYAADALDEVIDAINRSGYGLTLGIHSRIEATAHYIQSHARVGNTYVNRNQIGAVVGVQPFGGEGLSGTGPKAGGPHYLQRFALERTLTINTAAVGGNASLLSMDDE
jgi:RHH-type transcriptional regulator, proline utilization regulon repressor / proline dehydrogenase / delta 1-pyrroline-5-carboxylate dehydrogenase